VEVPLLTVLECWIETDFTGGGGDARLESGLCSGLGLLFEELPLLWLLPISSAGMAAILTFRLLLLLELPLPFPPPFELLLLTLVPLLPFEEILVASKGLLSCFSSSSGILFSINAFVA